MCDSQLSNQGDCIPFTNTDCVVNIQALQALWAISTIAHVAVFVFSIVLLKRVFERYKTMIDNNEVRVTNYNTKGPVFNNNNNITIY